MQAITKIVATNLFWMVSSTNHDSKVREMYDSKEEEPAMEPAWPLIQIVYELLPLLCDHSTICKLFFFSPQSKDYVVRAQTSFDSVKTHIKMGFIWIETSFDVLQ